MIDLFSHRVCLCLCVRVVFSQTRAAAQSDGPAGSKPKRRWEPDPIEADPTRSSRSRNTSDIISILINIHGEQREREPTQRPCLVIAAHDRVRQLCTFVAGNQDIFVQECRRTLADRLLTKSNFNVEQDTVRCRRRAKMNAV